MYLVFMYNFSLHFHSHTSILWLLSWKTDLAVLLTVNHVQ